jgi:cytochrome c biogenesis protein CcmG, thiol:disulfide interchange protein DsbE
VLVAAIVLACAAVGGVLAVGLANQDEVDDPGPTAPPGLAVPPFEPFAAPPVEGVVATGDGAGSILSLARLRGRNVVMNFGASWCDPCRREAPDLVAFAAEHPDVAMLGVNSRDARSQAPPFAEQQGFTWPSIEDRSGALADRFCLIGLPCTFVVDAAGRVVFRKIGEISREELDAAVDGLA